MKGRNIPRQSWQRDAVAVTVLLLAILCFDGEALLGAIPFDADNVLYCIPFFSLSRERPIALWDPYALCGLPLLGNLQYALFYPLRVPFLWFDSVKIYGPFCFTHWVIAAIGAYTLGRILRVRCLAALLGAMSFACGSFVQGRVSNPILFMSAAWVPFVVAATIRVAQKPTPRNISLAALALTTLATAGSPHNLFFTGIAICLVFGFALVGYPVGGNAAPTPTPRAHLWLAASALLALTLAIFSPTWWHAIALLPHAIRSKASFADVTEGAVRWTETLRLVFGGLGTPEYADKTSFQGVLGVVLLAAGAARLFSHRGTQRSTSAATALYAVMLCGLGLLTSLGAEGGIYYLIYAMPGFRFLIGPARALILFNLGWAILIMIAANTVLNSRGIAKRWLVIVTAAALLITAFAVQRHGLAAFTHAWKRLGSVPATAYFLFVLPVWLALASMGLWVTVHPHAPKLIGGALLAVLHFTNLWHFHQRQYLRFSDTDYFATPRNVEKLRTLPQADRTRMLCYDPLRLHVMDVYDSRGPSYLTPKLSDYFRIREAQGYDPLMLRDYVEFLTLCGGRSPIDDPFRTAHVAEPRSLFADITGARYIVGNPYVKMLARDPMRREARFAPQRVKAIHFVSVCGGATRMPSGAVVGIWEIENADGITTRIPVRLGFETADVAATDASVRCAHFAPPTVQRWRSYHGRYDRDVWFANYAGRIELPGEPELVRLAWKPRTDTYADFAVLAYGMELPAEPTDQFVPLTSATAEVPIYENRGAVPLAYLVDETSLALSLRETVTLLAARRDHLTSCAVVHDRAHVLRAPLRRSGTLGEAELQTHRAGEIRVHVRLEQAPALLVLTEAYYKGWRVWVNGTEAPVIKVNGVFQGVILPETGKFDVRFQYLPRSLPWTFLAAGTGLIVALAAIAHGMVPRRR